ncbi:MAG: efflux RND transporter permease subunit [Bacteroidetes bacterium]|nr:efflux RND transporter permease subunit [Bacteroidota bacterium]
MQLAKISINRPVLTTVIILVFIIFGTIAWFNINLNLNPDVEIPFITIVTPYPGAGPKEVETLVSKKIEDAVTTVSQIERVESYSLDGLSIVMIEFQLSKDINIASQEVKDKVDAIVNDLPTDSKKPIIQKVDFNAFPVVDVVLSGNLDSRELYEIADKNLRDRFSQISGVAKVDMSGGREREVRVVLDNRVAFENSISLPQLLQILKANNMDIPGGYFKVKDQEYTVRLKGEFSNIEEMKNLQIPTAFGPRKLGQIADVQDSGKDVRQRSIYYNNIEKYRNENVVRLGIIKSPDGNVVKVAEAIQAAIPDIEKSLPQGCKLEIVNDESIFVKSSVDDTMGNVIQGVLITSLVLFFFLYNIRSTIIVALSMPASIISTFFLLKAFGLTLNMMTLMGLSVTVGVLVANSIVVIENIFRYKSMGESNKQAAMKGTQEVMIAVLASTLTNLVIFLPIANMSSLVGRWMRELALAASFATLFSLLFSFTLTPMLASMVLPKTIKRGKVTAWFEKMEGKLIDLYRNSLRLILKNKWVSFGTLLITMIIFIASMGYYGPKLGGEFLPVLDDGNIKIEVELPDGYNLEATAKVLNEIETRVKRHKEVKYILTNLGQKSNLDIGTNMAKMDVRLVDVKKRNIKIQDMITVFVSELADIPNAKIKVDLGAGMGDGTAPITFYLLGQELSKLDELKDIVINKIKDTPGLINLDHSSRAGKPEITVYPDRVKLSEAGLTIMDVALTLRSSIEGLESSKYRESGNEYDITVTLSDNSVDSPEKIGNIPIVSPYGTYRLSQLAEVKFTTGYTRILRRDKYTAIQFSGTNAAGYPLGTVTNEVDKRIQEIKLPTGYSFKWGGSTKMMNEMFADMFFAFILASILTYMLMAAMLESFIQPLYIMMTLPLALIGVVVASYYTDTSLGITSLMGIIMLIGIVVNNAILMLDHVNQLKKEEGLSVKDALIEGAPIKMKPQIMSTLALIMGMLPMALGIGDAGKEMRTPLGIVSIGGLMVSTVLTLYVIPALYYFASRRKKKAVLVNE